MDKKKMAGILEDVRFVESVLHTINRKYIDSVREDEEAYAVVCSLLYGAEKNLHQLVAGLEDDSQPLAGEEIRQGLAGDAEG